MHSNRIFLGLQITLNYPRYLILLYLIIKIHIQSTLNKAFNFNQIAVLIRNVRSWLCMFALYTKKYRFPGTALIEQPRIPTLVVMDLQIIQC